MKSMLFDARMKRDSGIGVYIQNLLPALRSEFNLTVLGSDEADIPCEAPIYSLAEQRVFMGLKGKFDLMWSPHYNVPVFNPAKKKIVTIHDVFHLAFFETLSLKQKVYAQLMLRKAAGSDLILTVSDFSKKEIIKYLKPHADRVKTVYNGIDHAHFSKVYPAEQTQELDLKYGLSSPYVLFVGNVKPHKNLKNALLSFREYLNSEGVNKQLRFLIVGKKDGFITGDSSIAVLSAEPFFRDHVAFTGWVPDEDLPYIYQKASVFIFPSLYEGFGFPPLEAMAAGCPVISSDRACMPEIYGPAALYFDALDPASGAKALAQVLDDDGTTSWLVEMGKQRAAAFTWEHAIASSLEAIGRL